MRRDWVEELWVGGVENGGEIGSGGADGLAAQEVSA